MELLTFKYLLKMFQPQRIIFILENWRSEKFWYKNECFLFFFKTSADGNLQLIFKKKKDDNETQWKDESVMHYGSK